MKCQCLFSGKSKFASSPIGFDISCKLSPSFGDNLHEMSKPIFLGKMFSNFCPENRF